MSRNQHASIYEYEREVRKVISMGWEWARHLINSNGIGSFAIATAQMEPVRVDGHPFNDPVMTRTPASRGITFFGHWKIYQRPSDWCRWWNSYQLW